MSNCAAHKERTPLNVCLFKYTSSRLIIIHVLQTEIAYNTQKKTIIEKQKLTEIKSQSSQFSEYEQRLIRK